MTFLPILVRELRARGHNSATYWGRSAIAALGILVCVPTLMLTGPTTLAWTTFARTAPPVGGVALAGRSAFSGLVGAAFLLCCAACLLTADSISREKRAGTLILLLLTRVRHWDVLVGKFASVGLACFSGLLAFLPLLVLPLLEGGTSGGEAIRNFLALLNALFLALAAGLCSSAVGFERFRTSCMALALVAAMVLVPLPFGSDARLASPLGTIWLSADLPYRASPASFWISICLVQTWAWALVCGALVGMRKWLEQPVTSASSVDEPSDKRAEAGSRRNLGGSATVKCGYCGRTNSVDTIHCRECGTELFPKPVERTQWTMATAASPLHWLLGRQRGSEPMLWLAAGIMACQFAGSALGGRLFGFTPFAWIFFWAFGFISMTISGALIASVASRHVVAARQDGTLELLLTTPLGAEELVSTQWEIIKRTIRLPLLMMILPSIMQILFILAAGLNQSEVWYGIYALSVLIGIANIILSVAALCWVALSCAFRGMGLGRTVMWTVLVAHGLPYLLNLAYAMLIQVTLVSGLTPLIGKGSIYPSLLSGLVPQAGSLLFYSFLIRLARSRLHQNSL